MDSGVCSGRRRNRRLGTNDFARMSNRISLPCSGVLFDLDGVLIDSTPAVARVWKRWAIQHQLDPEEVVRRAHGRPSISTIRELLPQADLEQENLRVEQAEVDDIADVVPLPGARELLSRLPPDRW